MFSYIFNILTINDNLNNKSECWCSNCRVVIIIDFVSTGLMSMWLTLHHTEILLRQSCSVFWICTTLFPVVRRLVASTSTYIYKTFCRIWWYMQRYVINVDSEEYRSQDWPLWYTIFNSSLGRVGAANKDTLYSVFKVWKEKEKRHWVRTV